MKIMLKLKQSYIKFIERKKQGLPEVIFYCFLILLSYIYWVVVALRNFFYAKGILKSYQAKAKVISIGNISWAGSGKTSLTIWLEKRLSSQYKVAILRRGWGQDEELLLKENTDSVYSNPNRRSLAQELSGQYELFILDDGFQYRRLKPDLNIVLMGAREFKGKFRLIPAYFFREPLNSLGRADMIIVNYSNQLADRSEIIAKIKQFSPRADLYFSQYKVKRFLDLESNSFEQSSFKDKKIAAFTAIGYPQGFFSKIKELGLNLAREITYPDHHQLSQAEYNQIEEDLLSVGIEDLIITAKDRYHLPADKGWRLKIIVMEVELQIENETRFLSEIKAKLT